MKRLIVALVLASSGVAAADVPWAEGVTKDNQAKANALFAEANELFAQQAHAPALERYRAALALWDHPLIELNMAVTLIRLDRILEAADALDKALRYADAPFPTPEQYRQALDYQRLVAGRVGTLVASCTQPGAITLDGRPWFSCPGKHEKRVLAGEHTVVAASKGFMTVTQPMVVEGGSSTEGTFHFLPLEDLVTLEYPAPRWLPWAATGTGAAVALGGLAFWLAGNRQMDRFEEDFAEVCPDSCSGTLDANPTERQLGEQRDAARFKGDVGVVMMASGGAILVGGVVWTILNRPRRVLPNVEVAPTDGGVTAHATLSF